MASNDGSSRSEIQKLRRDKNSDDSSVMGYEDAAGVPQAVQGDQDAPWLKTPPFPSNVQTLFNDVLPLVPAPGYLPTGSINVKDRRLLLLWIRYTSADPDGQMSFIPEGAKTNEDGVFFPIAVVNPFLTVLGAPLVGFGSRTVFETELRLEPIAGGGVRTLGALAFDVSGYEAFRFRIGELSPTAGTVQLGYSFAS